jgi:hypothetical protein
MTLMKTSPSDLWVGAFVKTGALILFDPKLQVAEHDWVNLYSLSANGIRPFERSIVRDKIRRASPSEHEQAVQAYAEWSLNDNGEFVAGELLAKAQEEKKSASDLLLSEHQIRVERHRVFLEKQGKTGDAKIIEPRSNRAAHCYACECNLSSKSNLECTNCSWLICKCGACGCGYSKY